MSTRTTSLNDDSPRQQICFARSSIDRVPRATQISGLRVVRHVSHRRSVWNSQRGGADNIDKTFTLNLSAVGPNGTWALQVRDAAPLDGGYIDSWTLDP
jgi:hypothetical protein